MIENYSLYLIYGFFTFILKPRYGSIPKCSITLS